MRFHPPPLQLNSNWSIIAVCQTNRTTIQCHGCRETRCPSLVLTVLGLPSFSACFEVTELGFSGYRFSTFRQGRILRGFEHAWEMIDHNYLDGILVIGYFESWNVRSKIIFYIWASLCLCCIESWYGHFLPWVLNSQSACCEAEDNKRARNKKQQFHAFT